jgi:GMP synthase-like glutamine amidotransferase
VLFPGGNISININNTWTKGAKFILNYAMEQNNKGNIFPIYAICQGHQLLSYLTSGYDDNILQLVTK